tara:strand:+ start:339 stop:584 length:246 start_codon:yes stop_codon:yes gene_type:complete
MRLLKFTKETLLSYAPTSFGKFGGYELFEHPTLGDECEILMTTPNGEVIQTCFFDMGDFDSAGIELCVEIETDTLAEAVES